MFKFIKEIDTDNEFDIYTVEITVPYSGADLDTLIDAFEYFLKAVGFHPKGRIELVEEEESVDPLLEMLMERSKDGGE